MPIIVFEPKVWGMRTASLIQNSINAVLQEKGRCSVMLTGGRGAEKLFLAWAELPAFQQLRSVQFYFGDERCVPPDSLESNFGMAIRTLFRGCMPESCPVFRMEADDLDCESAADRYAEKLPAEIDVMLLGVGEDGHIASLFPGNEALQETLRRVVPVIGSKPPLRRMTITPMVISQARHVYVLASGTAKAAVLSKALALPHDVSRIPASLVLHGTWLLDSAVGEPVFSN